MKTKHFFTILVALYSIMTATLTVNAQTAFGEQQLIEYTEADGARDVHAADLDGDGDIDVLSASYLDNKIAWYENDGSGNFGIQQIITTTADNAQSVYAADLDNDGDVDILSASSNKIAWYENDGSGNFGVQQIITIDVISGRSVYAADLDNDGDIDVLSASAGDDKIAWYENDGSGNFGIQQIITTTADNAHSVYVADLDNDGDIDVLSASYDDNKIAWYENDGSGNFGTQQTITMAADGAYSVYVADLDNDGDMDVLSASRWDNKIAWYENDGSGNFGVQQIITTNADDAISVYAADLDNDGDVDVLSASEYDNKIAWYKNDGGGDFGLQQIITTIANGAWSVYAADLDNNGDMDVLSASSHDDKIAWYKNNGSGNFGEQQIITMTTNYPVSVYATDLDNDGDIDVLSASQNDNKIAWYKNNGSGNFGEQQIITTEAYGANSVYAADLDGDGYADVLSASISDDKIAWYKNSGGGNFGEQQIISSIADGAANVYASDLDGDDDLDVLSASAYDDKIVWYENDGSGNFGEQQAIAFADGAIDVHTADLDNDGAMDILSASYDDDKIAWYKTDSNGNFVEQQVITTSANGALSAADGAWAVDAADLDNDGDADVLSASYDDDKIAWYENDGSGNFGTQQIITTEVDKARSVYAVDLDNDGDIDILSISQNDGKVAWYENGGNGNFGTQQLIAITITPLFVYAVDLDNDGNADVLHSNGNEIAWHKNLLNNPHLSGTIFYDTNQNGTMDNGEFGLSNQNITLTPNPAYSYANNNGEFGFYSETAGTYTLSYNVPNGWTATTPTTQIITIGDGEFSTNNNFGIYPATFFTDVQPYITSGINRCNWTVPYYLTVINEGTTISPVSVVSLNPDERLTYVNANPAPDSIDTQGNLYWHIYNLLPTQQQQYIIDFQMPDFSAMGDTLSTVAAVYTYDNNSELIDYRGFGYRTTVVCSYDPNDKQVTPLGISEQNYTLINDDELIYTIRFQNTGNDTAFNILIADTLSQYFDHSTFRPITSSHPMQVMRYPSGLVEFKFNHIMLPDSTTNEPRSHGFVQYAIKAQQPVPDNTLISNTAYIYFDFNPAVVTNTTESLMVYELPDIALLPIELLYFEANSQPHGNLLRWATITEINNDHFVLWRSENGIDFKPIAQVAAKNNGNSHTTQSYQYTDQYVQQGKVYYRLQSVDKDGKAQYSHLVSIERKGTTSYYPNPITNTLTIQQPTPQTATYTLYNTLGEVVSKGTFDTPTHTIPVSHLPVGMYYLQVNGVSFKVMKQ